MSFTEAAHPVDPESSLGRLTADDIFGSPLSLPMPAVVQAMKEPDRALRMDQQLSDTDVLLAQVFALKHQDRHRFDHAEQRWFNYEAPVWSADRDGAPQRAVQRFMFAEAQARILKPQGARAMEEATRLAKRMLDARAVDRVLRLAQSQEGMAEDGSRWNDDPFALGASNGVVDLRRGTLRFARPDDRLTHACNAAFDSGARCPVFLNFLDQVFQGDAERIGFVHRFFGYCLTGVTTEQVLLVQIGTGGNGKTVLQEAIAHVLGTNSRTVPISTFLASQNRGIPSELADLPGVRLVNAAEPRQAVTLDEGIVKQVTGGDEVACRHLYGRWFTFKPQFKLVISANHQPRVTDLSNGFWRRVRVLPFRRTFDGADRDKGLPEKLKGESDGIFQWLLDGCLQWQRDGLGTAGEIEAAVNAWKSDSDLVKEFLEQGCELDPTESTRGADMLRAFEQWCEAERVGRRDRPGRTIFGTRLKALVQTKQTNRGIVYIGVRPRVVVA